MRALAALLCSARRLTRVPVVHQADALDGAKLLKLVAQLALRDLVAQPRHKQRLVRVALRKQR